MSSHINLGTGITSGLTRVEERLQRVVDEFNKQNLKS
jgi:hypothetical protein